MAGTFLWNFIKIRSVVSEKKMFKEKVNALTDARTDGRTTDNGPWHKLAGLRPVELKIFFSETAGQILKKIHRNVPWVNLFKYCSQNFDPSLNLALVNGGFLHSTDMKNFLKSLLLRNRRSDFEIILQESGFYISGHPDCVIPAITAMGKLP